MPKHNNVPKPLDEKSLAVKARKLAASEPDFARLLQRYGTPPLWAREPGFATLIHIILEQQVSLASAKAAYHRLTLALTNIAPKIFLTLDDAALKTIGFSRQKTLSSRLLAEAILTRQLDLELLPAMPDDEVRFVLKQRKGIGDWTADIYLLMALRRPDVWPPGDLALLVALQKLKQLPTRPSPREFAEMGVQWKPYRAIAARFLWHYYLSERNYIV